MFWKFDLHTTSNVDKLLDKEDVTLRELMDEDDILQECKAQNRRLLLFLTQDQCMQELVGLITQEPPLDVEERLRFKYPNIACELLTSDVGHINDKLGGDEPLMERLYGLLEQEPPLNPLLTSFFSKTIGNLIARKTEQVIAFLRKKEGFISLVLKHIDTSAMMDLLLRLISCVEPAPLRQEVLNWLNEEKLIQSLIGLIRAEEEEERQSNASQTLCDVIRLSRDQLSQLQEPMEPDPLLTVLESQESVEELLNNMFLGEKSEACIVNGTQVLLTLLETRRPGVEGLMDLCSQGYERLHTVSSSVLQGIEPHLRNFHALLLNPPKKSAMLTSMGVLDVPLGNSRLHIARLVAALLQTCSPSLGLELCRLNTMDLLLDLFFQYAWNNFLHLQVELCVAAILNQPCTEELLRTSPGAEDSQGEQQGGQGSSAGAPHPPSQNVLVAHLFQKCHLVQRILDAWEENDRTQAAGGMRRGNMGHLTHMANAVVQSAEKGPVQAQISHLIKELPEDCQTRWEHFIDQTLMETNRRNTVDLVSTHNLHSSSEDDDMEGPFPNELSLQQAFSDYQIQQMTANFVDQFGFNDEEFAEQEDNINAAFDRIAEINFSLDVDDDGTNAAAFEACCKERIQQFDDHEDEEDIWEEREINYATQVKKRTRFGVSRCSENPSSTDTDNGQEDRNLGSDEDGRQLAENAKNRNQARNCEAASPEGPGWTDGFGELPSSRTTPPNTALDVGSAAWDGSVLQHSAVSAEETGWAKFSDLQSSQCPDSRPRCTSPVDHNTVDGGQNKSQAPCNWTICPAQKAPLVASDSSSSGGSDSEEEEEEEEDDDKTNVVTETITTGTGRETIKLTVDAKNEKAVFRSAEVDSIPIDKLAVSEGSPGKGPPPDRPGPVSDPPGAATPSVTTKLTVTDRREEASESTATTLNGPA